MQGCSLSASLHPCILCQRAESKLATVANKTRHDCLMHVAPQYHCLSFSTPQPASLHPSSGHRAVGIPATVAGEQHWARVLHTHCPALHLNPNPTASGCCGLPGHPVVSVSVNLCPCAARLTVTRPAYLPALNHLHAAGQWAYPRGWQARQTGCNHPATTWKLQET